MRWSGRARRASWSPARSPWPPGGPGGTTAVTRMPVLRSGSAPGSSGAHPHARPRAQKYARVPLAEHSPSRQLLERHRAPGLVASALNRRCQAPGSASTICPSTARPSACRWPGRRRRAAPSASWIVTASARLSSGEFILPPSHDNARKTRPCSSPAAAAGSAWPSRCAPRATAPTSPSSPRPPSRIPSSRARSSRRRGDREGGRQGAADRRRHPRRGVGERRRGAGRRALRRHRRW